MSVICAWFLLLPIRLSNYCCFQQCWSPEFFACAIFYLDVMMRSLGTFCMFAGFIETGDAKLFVIITGSDHLLID